MEIKRGKMLKKILFTFIFTISLSVLAVADTTDQKWMTKVELKKTGAHCEDDRNCLIVIIQRFHQQQKLILEI